MWNINCILYSMNNLCFHDNTFLLPAMLRWGKQLNIWPFCESDDKISTLRQRQQNWAHHFHDKLSQYLFSLFLKSLLQHLCMSLSKFRTSLSLVWRKCHPKIIGYAEKISKSEPNLKYLRICILLDMWVYQSRCASRK